MELQSFRCSESLISSQFLSRVIASIIKVWVKPFDLARADLVLLSSVRLAAVLISVNQSSNCAQIAPIEGGYVLD